MASVRYKRQPQLPHGGGVDAALGYPYRVTGRLWETADEDFIDLLLRPRTLHVCCGHSQLGDVRLDNDPEVTPDVVADAAALPFDADAFQTVLCDPPYQGGHQWNHDVLSELSRVASERIVFQHWFVPATHQGGWRKAQDKFSLSALYVITPRTYFGRVQVVSVFDRSSDA